jgi:hypothetical protein
VAPGRFDDLLVNGLLCVVEHLAFGGLGGKSGGGIPAVEVPKHTFDYGGIVHL